MIYCLLEISVFGFKCAGGCMGNIYIFISVGCICCDFQKFANLSDFIFGAILPVMAHTSTCVCLSESNQIRRELRTWQVVKSQEGWDFLSKVTNTVSFIKLRQGLMSYLDENQFGTFLCSSLVQDVVSCFEGSLNSELKCQVLGEEGFQSGHNCWGACSCASCALCAVVPSPKKDVVAASSCMMWACLVSKSKMQNRF